MKQEKHTSLPLRLTAVLSLALLIAAPAQAAVTWYWNPAPGNQAIKDQIAGSMNSMKGSYNAHSSLTFSIPVSYDSSVPTANATYLGRIKFGGLRSAYVAHHETGHIFGVGTQGQWNPFVNSNREWTGARGIHRYRSYNGPTATLKADSQHFWNYGMNTGWENPERHVKMVLALRNDMNL